MFNEGIIQGACNFDPSDVKEVMDILTSRCTCIHEIVTHHMKLDEINEAMHLAYARNEAMKVVIDID